MENAIKIIETICKQWPFLVVVFFIIVFIIKWKTIWAFIASITKIKVTHGKTEVEIDKSEETKSSDDKTDEIESQDKTNPTDSEEEQEVEDTLESSYYKLLTEREYSKAKKLFVKILEETEEEKDRKDKKLNNFYWRHIHGDTTAFEELESYIENIENDDEHKSLAFYNLSFFYIDATNYPKSIELLESAINMTKDDKRKALCLSKISDAYYKNNDYKSSLNVLLKNLKTLRNKDSLVIIYRAIADYYKKRNDKFLESVAYQKTLELKPNDTSVLFDAAYNYSEVNPDFKDLGYFLYKKLIRFNPENNGALNNLGVAANKLGLNFGSVEYYKSAIEKGNSLAASNLAYLLIDKGFKEEPEAYLNKAQEFENVHDNVYSAASRLKDDIRNEKKSEEKILKKAENKYLLLNSFGSSVFNLDKITIDTTKNWFINGQSAKIKVENENIEITWETGEEKHKIHGKILNNSLFVTYVKPKRKLHPAIDSDKFLYVDWTSFGFVENENKIVCFTEIEKELLELRFSAS